MGGIESFLRTILDFLVGLLTLIVNFLVQILTFILDFVRSLAASV